VVRSKQTLPIPAARRRRSVSPDEPREHTAQCSRPRRVRSAAPGGQPDDGEPHVELTNFESAKLTRPISSLRGASCAPLGRPLPFSRRTRDDESASGKPTVTTSRAPRLGDIHSHPGPVCGGGLVLYASLCEVSSPSETSPSKNCRSTSPRRRTGWPRMSPQGPAPFWTYYHGGLLIALVADASPSSLSSSS